MTLFMQEGQKKMSVRQKARFDDWIRTARGRKRIMKIIIARERIDQIYKLALRRLRNPARIRKLRAFLEGPSRDWL
jgi:hypothetical protein